MKKLNRSFSLYHNKLGGTASPGFHLSETINWSSLSAQVKNRLILLPVTYVPIDRLKKKVTR